MGLTLPCPDHTTLSRRNATVAIQRPVHPASIGPIDLIVDRSGLQICGHGEWHEKQHGEKKVGRWKQLHLGLDDQGQISASTVTDSREQDPSQVPELWMHIEREMGRCIGDGLSDQEPVSTAVEEHAAGARMIIPPRKDAVLSPTATTVPT